MKNFKQILEEVNYTLSVMIVFDTILWAIIIFLSCYLVLNLFSINGYFGLVPAVSMFFWKAVKRLRTNKLKTVEDSNAKLQEKLRTARDYLYKKNPFVEDLQDEIAEHIKTVQTSSFFDEKRTYVKSGIIIGLCILMLVVAPYQIVLFDFNDAVSDLIERDDKDSTNLPPRERKPEYQLVSVEDDWYGEFSIGQLGDEDMHIQLIETNYKLTSDVVEDPEKKVFQEVYPEEINVERGASYEDREIGVENQEIVKNYFKEISK